MGRQGEKRQVGAARRRSRGHGPARLDGTRPRATVASKVMDSGKMAEQATARSSRRPHASEARSAAGAKADPARPVRRYQRGAKPSAAGMGCKPIPRRQAQRAGPDQGAGQKASAEHCEGTMEARRGETPRVARCASTTARPALPLGRRRTDPASDSYGMGP